MVVLIWEYTGKLAAVYSPKSNVEWKAIQEAKEALRHDRYESGIDVDDSEDFEYQVVCKHDLLEWI